MEHNGQQFYEQNPNPMLIFDRETLEILDVNKSATETYGYDKKEFSHLTLPDIYPPGSSARITSVFQDATHELQLGPHRHRTKTGDDIFANITLYPYSLENRDAQMVQIHEVTQQVHQKKELKSTCHELRYHINNIPLALVTFNSNFEIIRWSDKAEELSGYSKDEVLGKTHLEIGYFADEELPFISERMEAIASGDIDQDCFDTYIYTNSGERLDIQLNASARRDHEGNLLSVLTFIQDITPEKKVHRELARRSKAMEASMDGMAILDAEGRYTYMNKAHAKKYGYESPDELIGESWKSLYRDKELSYLESEVMPTLCEEGTWRGESLGLRKDGSVFAQEVSLSRLKNVGLVGSVRDISERWQTEQKLEVERQHLKHAQELAGLGWWTYDAVDDQTMWSEELYEILGVDKEQFEGGLDAFFRMVHPKDRRKLEKVLSQAQQTQQPLTYTLRIIKPDESVIYLKSRAQSELDSEGNLVSLSGVAQDVTKFIEKQKELDRNKSLFEKLFVNSPVANVLLDTEGRVQKVNNSFVELFGYTESELQGKNLLKHTLPEGHTCPSNQYGELYTGESKYYEAQRATKGGQLKNLIIGVLPVSISREPTATFGIFIDITKLRNTERQLKDSLQEKVTLLAEIHHRVKNNLAVICSLMELQAMEYPSPELQSLLATNQQRIKAIAQIHELLYQSESFSHINLANNIQQLVESIDGIFGQQKDITIDIQADPIRVNINQAIPCALIINEIVTNAYKHAFPNREDGMICVGLSEEDNRIQIEVQDNGIGLPEEKTTVESPTLGMKLIHSLTQQLEADLDMSGENGTQVYLEFAKSEESGSSNAMM